MNWEMNLSKKEGQARRDEARGGIHIPRHADLRGLALHRIGWERALLLVTNIFFIDLLDSLESTLYSICPTKNKIFFLKKCKFQVFLSDFLLLLGIPVLLKLPLLRLPRLRPGPSGGWANSSTRVRALDGSLRFNNPSAGAKLLQIGQRVFFKSVLEVLLILRRESLLCYIQHGVKIWNLKKHDKRYHVDDESKQPFYPKTYH